MTNLEDVQRKLSTIIAEKAELGARVFELQTEIDKLKQQPEPCPLEEGKEVHCNRFREHFMEIWSGYLSVSSTPDKRTGYIHFKIPFGNYNDALNQAQKIVRADGNSD